MSEALAELALRAERRKMQDEFSIWMKKSKIPGSGTNRIEIVYTLGGRRTGTAELYDEKGGSYLHWVSYYPRDYYTDNIRNGYGTLTHCTTVALLLRGYGFDSLIGHGTNIKNPRRKQLESMLIDYGVQMRLEEYYERSVLYAQTKDLFIDMNRIVISDGVNGFINAIFPSPLNALNCNGCLGISCPLSNAMTERHLSEGLDRRAPQEQYSDRQVGGDPLHRQIMYRDRDTGFVNAQCIRIHPDASEEVLGIYPLPNAR